MMWFIMGDTVQPDGTHISTLNNLTSAIDKLDFLYYSGPQLRDSWTLDPD